MRQDEHNSSGTHKGRNTSVFSCTHTHTHTHTHTNTHTHTKEISIEKRTQVVEKAVNIVNQ